MSKGLEALEQLYLQFNPNLTSEDNSLKYKNTIEKELKALEIIDDGIEFQFLEKKENNQVKYIVRLINFDNPSQCFEWDMEKEKYDLLKEVLLWF